jgi:hypothetical protein
MKISHGNASLKSLSAALLHGFRHVAAVEIPALDEPFPPQLSDEQVLSFREKPAGLDSPQTDARRGARGPETPAKTVRRDLGGSSNRQHLPPLSVPNPKPGASGRRSRGFTEHALLLLLPAGRCWRPGPFLHAQQRRLLFLLDTREPLVNGIHSLHSAPALGAPPGFLHFQAGDLHVAAVRNPQLVAAPGQRAEIVETS